PPTARALHATVEIDEEIEPEYYQAVAVAIRFADALRAKARARRAAGITDRPSSPPTSPTTSRDGGRA
ncbi:MAG: EscU/YscU/HrcU family type III secretion system export apparatus switch protein, partial [Pseudomonadota bacterium]